MVFERGDIIRWLYGRIFGRPMNFTLIDESVAGSAGPISKKEVDWMRNQEGIAAILSVREWPLNAGWVEGLEYLNVPVRNHYAPTMDQLKECVNFILGQTEAGKKIDVHCAAGKGRTGTVLAAYLCYKKGLSADDAINQIRRMRPGSIERNQERIIHEYKDELGKPKP